MLTRSKTYAVKTKHPRCCWKSVDHSDSVAKVAKKGPMKGFVFPKKIAPGNSPALPARTNMRCHPWPPTHALAAFRFLLSTVESALSNPRNPGQLLPAAPKLVEMEAREPSISTFPNPTTADATLVFRFARTMRVQAELVDASGRRVQTLFSGVMDGGINHQRSIPTGRHAYPFKDLCCQSQTPRLPPQ